jgi:hypothetical protein
MKINERETTLATSKRLAAFLGCNPPVALADANRLIEAFAVGKRGQEIPGKLRQPADWFKPLKRKPYEYKSTRHIPSIVAGKRVYWSPI